MATNRSSIFTSPFRNWRYIAPYTRKIGYIGWLGHHNLGDEALYLAFKKLFPQFSIVPFIYNERIQLVERLKGNRVYHASFLGGGTLINRVGYLEDFKAAQSFYQPSFVLGAGVANPEFWDTQPGWENSFGEWVNTLNKCSFVGVRGPLSKKLLAENGFTNAEITGDTALFFAKEKIVNKKGSKHLGINMGSAGSQLWGNEGRLLDCMVSFAKLMLDKGWRITFVPVLGSDTGYILEAIKRIGRPVGVFQDYSSVEKTLNFLETCDLFIGMKLHSVILAMCANTPSIMLEYRPKCLDFMLSMGLEKFNMRTDNFSIELLLSLTEELSRNSGHYQEIIGQKTNYYRQLQTEKAKSIVQVIEKWNLP